MIRAKISSSFFLLWSVRAFWWGEGEKEKRRRRKKEEEKKRRRRNPGMEFMFGTSLLFGTLVYVGMEPIYGFVGYETTLTLYLSMFGLGKP